MCPLLLLAAISCAAAQQPPFTLDQVLSAAFPSELTAAPAAGRIAWVSNARGIRNIMIAEPPRYEARKLTNYTQDDGEELSDLRWTPDASAIVYVRGLGPNSAGENANPTLNPKGAERAIWIAPLDGPPARRIGEGSSPAVSPKGDRVAFVRRGQIWSAPLDGKSEPAEMFHARGQNSSPLWSPDGSRLAFTSSRGDHSFIGVYDIAAGALRYLDPSTGSDSQPDWSPDGRNIVFLREPSTGLRAVRMARRAGEPWSIRVASAETGAGREIWRANEGPGSVFRGITADRQLMWTGSNRIVFPWESDGWTHLYAVPSRGGKATLLTPGAFEVEHVALAPYRREIVYSSNQDDIDGRHLWRVAVIGGAPRQVTSGPGIEVSPVVASDGAVAFLRSNAQHPLRVAIQIDGEVRDLDPSAVPSDFPSAHMVTPRSIVFPSADGLPIHAQLFLPPHSAGRAPALVFFHGGSRRQMLTGWHYMYYYSNAYAFNQYLANLGYVVLSVNYRSGIGYGLDFREALNYGPSGGSEYKDVQGAATYLRSRPDVDPERIAAWGGSYGGYLTAMALARASDLYKAGVDFHGVHNWAVELGIPRGEPDYQLAFDSSPLAFVKTWRSPVLLIAGDDDRDVLFNNTVMLAAALRKQHVDVEELIFPDEIHDFLLHRTWLTAYEAAARFLNRRLRPGTN
jgi:dipeptidyl aminopeptidase/acylaminoacyl peptidase